MTLFRNTFVAALCAASASAGYAQATPAATAPTPYSQFALPDVGGSLRYALSASESVLTGYNGNNGGGVSAYTNLSGDLAYLSRSTYHPFSAVYAGGYLIGGSRFPSYFYQSLTLSQSIRTQNWNFVFGDSVSYLPQTPVGDLSGIPASGDLGIPSVGINSSPTLGILTTYATRVSNTASGTASRTLTPNTTLSFSGADSLQRYTGSSTNFQGINNDQQSASASLQHRLSERTSIGGSYAFTNSTFSASRLLGAGKYGFQTHSVQGIYNHQFTPNLNLSASAGPQWVGSGSYGGTTSGSSVSVSASAMLGYTTRKYTTGVSYSRGVNNGNGVVVGSRQDSLIANINHPFKRIYSVGGLLGYNHSNSLSNSTLANFSTNAFVAGGQFSAQFKPSLSAFVSYTAQRQVFGGITPSGIAFNGTTQYVTVGVTYSPKPFYRK